VTTLKNKVAEGDEYFAVAHIFASFNDTFVVSLPAERNFSPAASHFLCVI
jgi:ribosomal protein S11